jgi:hypothetical protein
MVKSNPKLKNVAALFNQIRVCRLVWQRSITCGVSIVKVKYLNPIYNVKLN